MVIPRTLSADEFKAAPPDDQSLYSKGDDGNYNFIGENAGELRRGKSRVSGDLAKAQRERDEALSKLQEFERVQAEAAQEKEAKEAKKTADVKQIDEYWKTKHQKELKNKDETISRLQESIVSGYRDSVVNAQASKLALPGHEYVIKLALKERINASLDSDGRPQTIIYDQDGRPGHDTLDDLVKDFKKDPRFKALLKGNEVGSGTAKPPKQSVPAGDQKPTKQPVFPTLASDEARQAFSGFHTAGPDRITQFLKSMQTDQS